MLNHKHRILAIALTLVGSFIAIVTLQLLEIELDQAIMGALYTLFVGGVAALADAYRVRDRVIDDPELLRRMSKPNEEPKS